MFLSETSNLSISTFSLKVKVKTFKFNPDEDIKDLLP